ncbi:SDR family oxidoreductase [Algoriphagus sanaruensis]|uniref:Short-chain dehydrogenase n=1 Tax=Algoriphagus sanaruensis TaxID=1727163 RepID=A0A142EPV7_9BACT|nr:SDR family oxidoreductase [Algoriphagus sanaruensis]AMQ57162.1 hypothetical protein AO498_12005 [Algoriphagus sanaruensis]
MKVALVTGAAKGLGLEWCHQLGLKGYKVILTARNFEQAQLAASELNQQDLVIYPKALDVANESEIEDLASWATELFGRVDLIVNNAGINPKDYADKSRMAKAFNLSQLDYQEMLQVIQINSLAPLMMVKHFLPLLKKSEKPLVVNISSWLSSVSQLSFGGHYGYVGSKNLLNVLNKSMALELKNEGIICVNVNPGWVKTQMGGQKATFTTEESVKNLIKNIVEKVSLEETGSFLNFDGSPHPW